MINFVNIKRLNLLNILYLGLNLYNMQILKE